MAHRIRNTNEDLLPAPCAFGACVPVHPSAEVNFAVPRQFSASVPSIVMLVVFRVLFLTMPTTHKLFSRSQGPWTLTLALLGLYKQTPKSSLSDS
jgi:hypothetical protein